MTAAQQSISPEADQEYGKFLVVVDDTPECIKAMQFAARRARHVGGSVLLLYIIDPPDFQHWLAVKDVMREEAREEAMEVLRGCAVMLEDEVGPGPELIVREGKRAEQIQQLLEEDHAIRYFVLAAGTESEGPGPLVKLFATQLIGSMPVPVVIIPGHLTIDQLEEIA